MEAMAIGLPGVTGPLAGLHVVEIADRDLRPLRRKAFRRSRCRGHQDRTARPETRCADWGPFPDGVPDPQRSGLFEYLNAGKRLCRCMADARELIARAHVLVENFAPGTLEGWGFDVDSLNRLNPNLVLLRISALRAVRTVANRQATSLTLQAASGWISARDPDRPPVQVGARIAEYVAGAYGALGALTALRLPPAGQVVAGGRLASSNRCSRHCRIPMLMAQRMRSLGLPTNVRSGPDAGRGPRRRRLGGDQLPDGSALARRVRDARPARVSASSRSRS